MLCTDLLNDVAFYRGLTATQKIPAQNIHVVLVGKLVAEFFELDRRLSVAD